MSIARHLLADSLRESDAGKIVSARAAVPPIDDGDTVATAGFVATFTARELEIAVREGRLRILEDGMATKFVDAVEHRTFSGPPAVQSGPTVRYITERCVFRLTAEGLELIEIAPGVDLQKDILDRMDFRPRTATPVSDPAFGLPAGSCTTPLKNKTPLGRRRA